MNRRRDNVIDSLNPGKERCSQCGMTFDESQQLDDHLDDHFRQNMKMLKFKNLRTKVKGGRSLIKIKEGDFESRKMYLTKAVSFLNININFIIW